MDNKIYQVFIQDEWNNNYFLGFYKTLKGSIRDINQFLKVYGVKIKSSDLRAHASTLGECFDTCLADVFEDNEDVACIYIRGFIFDKKDLEKQIKKA